MWRSRKDFESDLFKSYKKSRLQLMPRVVPMGAALIGYKARTHKVATPRRVATALRVLDDLMLDAILWHHALAMLLQAKPDDPNSLQRSISALLMRIVQDAIVVRNLVQAGFDVQAKNLLRSIDEHVDAVYYLCLTPEACEEFVRADDDESTNQFWWKHIRRSHKKIDDAVAQIIKVDAHVREMREFRLAEGRMLSSVPHPSYVASTMPFLVPYKGVNVSMYMFGLPNEYSYRTAKLLFYILAELAVLIGLLNSEIGEVIARKRGDALQKIVRRGRLHLGAMAIRLVQNWNCPLFSNSAEMKRFLKDLPQQSSNRSPN